MLKGTMTANTTQPVECQVYMAMDIATMLHIGRTKVYDFLDQVYEKQEPFRVLKVGTCVRVPKESFDKWFFHDSLEQLV